MQKIVEQALLLDDTRKITYIYIYIYMQDAYTLKDAAVIIAPSLTKLFNLSICSHKFPELWKCAKVTALFKSNDKANRSNYRPISVLPALSKIFEKIVHTQLYK